MILLSVKPTLSSKNIRRGDQFGIYLDIKNGFTENITIIRTELCVPMGFFSLDRSPPEAKSSGTHDALQETSSANSESVRLTPPDKKTIVRFELLGLSDTVAGGKDNPRRYEYNLQAGTSIGSDPKPDTHTISFKFDYKKANDNLVYQEAANIDISIFPSFTSMLIGTLAGSILGTMATANFSFNFMDIAVLKAIAINLILAFIAGVILGTQKRCAIIYHD